MKYLFKIHELWKNLNVCSQCMNYEDIFCNKWIIKIRKCLFAIHELRHFVCITWIMKKMKCLFAMHELWNYFVCNTWIMKIPFETHESKIGKYLFAINELWKN